MGKPAPVIRLNLWIETSDGMYFGLGRALLLSRVQEHGSLKKAAEDLGMSYRAAWGKIRKTEEIIGEPLVVKTGDNKRNGCHLTDRGRRLLDQYMAWIKEVEGEALRKAEEIFSAPFQSYPGGQSKRREKTPGAKRGLNGGGKAEEAAS